MALRKLKRTSRVLLFAFAGVLGLAVNAETIGFKDGYEIDRWNDSEITGGTTEINGITIDGMTLSAEFRYTVRLNGGGVTARTADYTVSVPGNGTVTFDWEYTGNHRFFRAFAEFHVIVNGEEVLTLVDSTSFADFNFSGVDQTIAVKAGDTFGFRIGGSNFDSNSALDGLLRISRLRVEESAPLGLGLIISKNDPTPDNFDFQWSSRSGKVYDLLSSTDLSVPVENWMIWDGRSNIPSGGDMTQIEAVASEGPQRFFMVIEKSPPPN